MPTICIIGLGYIGLPTAVIFATNGFKVIGVDLNKSIVDKVNKGESHISEPELENELKFVIKNGSFTAQLKPTFADIYIIAVPTPHYLKENNFYYPDISKVYEAFENICPYLKQENLIIIESTSPIGTTEEIAKLIFKKTNLNDQNLHITYCPERVLPGNILYELMNNDRIIGGITKEASIKAKMLYSKICKGDLLITNARTAELAKLSENAYRDVNIAFANELSVICDEIDIDIKELINLTNRHPRVNILNPGCGVGGHCIAIDPWFIASQFPDKSHLIQTARKVNSAKTKFVLKKIKKITDSFEEKNKKKAKIGCLGLAFKPNIDDLRESPALDITKTLMSEDYDVYAAEPNIKCCNEIKLYNLKDIINKVDLLFILVAHKEFKYLKSDQIKIFDFSNR